MFAPVWMMFFAWGVAGPFISWSKFYEKHPGIAWPLFLSLVAISGVYMIFLKRVMLRIVLDKSMSASTRNVLWVLPPLPIAVLGALLGLWLKRQFSG